MIVRLDVNVGSAILHRRVDDVVDQLDHGRLAGDQFQVAEVGDLLLDDAEVLIVDVLVDIVDDEDVGVGEVALDRGADVGLGGGDNLDGAAALPFNLLHEEEILELADGDRKDAFDLEEGVERRALR